MNTLIFIASDHRGFAMKKRIAALLEQDGFSVQDLGPTDDTRCDASDYALKVAAEMKKNPSARGVLICATGQSMAMTANRFQHIRAALCTNGSVARYAREHNDANLLALGADVVTEAVALECLEIFLTTNFLGGRYAERVKKLTDLGGL